ncbi:MAG: FG-GAP-like repeat-containing protein, partial [Nitrospinota bacterium]
MVMRKMSLFLRAVFWICCVFVVTGPLVALTTFIDESGKLNARQFVNFSEQRKDLVWGDFNGDGMLDIFDAITNKAGPGCTAGNCNFWLRNDLSTIFAFTPFIITTPFDTTKTSYDADVFDFDNDGDLDVLLVDDLSTLLFVNPLDPPTNNTVVFNGKRISPPGVPLVDNWDDAAIGDINQDGKLDILLALRRDPNQAKKNVLLKNNTMTANTPSFSM